MRVHQKHSGFRLASSLLWLNSFLEEMKTVSFITECRLDELGVTESIDEETRIEGFLIPSEDNITKTSRKIFSK